MVETLFIHLGKTASDKISWMVWQQAEQTIIASGELANAEALTQLTEKAKQRTVIALVDASALVFKSLTIPAKNQRAMQLATPYALEDELASDVESLFFAFPKQHIADDEHNCHVAIVAKQQLALWQQWLTEAGIFCQTMLPDALLLPTQTDAISLLQLGEQWLIKAGNWQLASVSATIAEHWLTQLKQSAQSEQQLTVQHYSPLTLALPEQVTVQAMAEELPLALLAPQAAHCGFNLLQAKYEVKSPSSNNQKWWFMSSALAASVVLMVILVKVMTLQQLNQQISQVEQQVVDEYKRLVPDAKRVRVSTVKSQLKRLLQQSGTSGDSDLFQLLSKVQAGFETTPSLKPSSIKFDAKRGELRLQANAASYQDFERFKASLERKQLQVTQGALNNQGEQISGSYSIKG